MYAPQIFDAQPNSNFLPALISGIQVLFSLFTIPLIDRVPRKVLFVIGAILTAIAHMICCIALDEDGENTTKNWFFNVGAMLSAGVFNTTYGAITYFIEYPIVGFTLQKFFQIGRVNV